MHVEISRLPNVFTVHSGKQCVPTNSMFRKAVRSGRFMAYVIYISIIRQLLTYVNNVFVFLDQSGLTKKQIKNPVKKLRVFDRIP